MTQAFAPAVSDLDLIALAKAGDRKAMGTLIDRNRGLLHLLLRRMHVTKRLYDDAYQEAVLGFMRAVEKFDANAGAKLQTYASFWVAQRVMVLIATESNAIGSPVGKKTRSRKMLAAIRQCDSTAQDRFGLSDLDLLALMRLVTTPSQIMPDTYIMPTDCDPTAHADQTRALDRIRALLPSLSSRERTVIELRYFRRQEYTLADIARMFGVSRERVRQHEENAIAKLKARLSV